MKFLLQILAVTFVILAFQSCKNTPVISPSDESGMMKTDIGEGKVIFIRDCTRCHKQKTVEDYTSKQWSNILPRMIIKAELNDTESRQVTAYIEWELENN